MLEAERIFEELKAADARYSAGGMSLNVLARNVGRLPESPEAAVAELRSVKVPGISEADIELTDTRSATGFLQGVRKVREEALRSVDDSTVPVNDRVNVVVPRMISEYSHLVDYHRKVCTKMQGGRRQW